MSREPPLKLRPAERLRARIRSLPQLSQGALPDYSANPKWFPNVISSYKQQRVPAADLDNTKSLSEMIHDGKIELSLSQFAAAVVENNLTLAEDRYNNYFAQADLLRTKSGQAARGVSAANVSIPNALSSGAIGTGVGFVGALAGGIGGVGSITGSGEKPHSPGPAASSIPHFSSISAGTAP